MLNIDPIVRVDVHVGTTTASAGVFDVGAILGSNPVAGKFDSSHRFKEYESLAAMSADGFSDSSDEYKAAEKYFGVSPAPAKVVMIYYFANPAAEAYDSTASYAVGEYCTNLGKLWKCITAIAEGGETWNASHWEEVTSVDENPAAAVLDAIDQGAEFYALYYIPAASATGAAIKANIAGIASAFDSLNKGVVFYGVIGTVQEVTDASALFKSLKEAGAERAVGLYCAEDIDDAAGLMGVAMGLAAENAESAFVLCYKTVGSATVTNITQTDVEAIKAVNGNVYVQRTRARAFIENGAAATGMRFDEILYIDRMTYEIQQAIYELIADSVVKLPQTDSTSTLFINAIYEVLERYYDIGVLQTAMWRGNSIAGVIEKGDFVEHGHAEHVESFDTQSEADRLQHKAMPITVLLCLSGSVESIVINVDVQT